MKSPRPSTLSGLKTALVASVALVAIAVAAPLATSAVTAPAAASITAPEQGFADLVEKVSPAVVSVIVKKGASTVAQQMPDMRNLPEPFRRFFGPDFNPRKSPGAKQRPQMGQGSGFFISADGYIVTNNHVVEDADEVTIRLNDGKELEAKVIGTDKKTDVALLKVDERTDFPFVTLSSKPARVGDWVVAVGNPFGLGGTVTAGIVSARGRDIGAGPYDDFIQIDASVNRGNSGGPAFSLDGSVIGVNTAIFSPSGGNVGIAFAIPASTVEQVVAQLKSSGMVARGWLGVQIQPVNEDIAQGLGLDEAGGALVAQIMDDSPAGKAGLKVGDAITEIDGQPVKDARDLVRKIGAMTPDQTTRLIIWRGDEEQEITVTLGTQPGEQKVASLGKPSKDAVVDANDLGISLASGSEYGADGVVITEVAPDGPAAEIGLEPGIVILQANGQNVHEVSDVTGAISAAKRAGRKSVLLLVTTQDGQANRFVAVPFAKA